MSAIMKYLKILLFLNLWLLCHCKAHDNGLKINTDLTAGIIGDVSADNTKQILGDSLNPSTNHTQNVQSSILASASLEDKHICTREEEYVEQIRSPSMQPVKIRTSTWCLEFPPRCSNYQTEMREIVKVQNVTKTRTIRFCCAGYDGNLSMNDTVCKPVCRSGCGRGFCLKPDICSCEPGYMGKHCTQRCDHDHWGLECKNVCQCHNGAACDNKSGTCHCAIGWTGEFCEKPCPMGTHGVMCRKACECENKLCHPQTGACEVPATNAPLAPNATHAMIATLNSTIVNITHNLDRIAKNIVSIATSTTTEMAHIPQLMEVTTTTIPTVPEVIVIKQDGEVPHTPKIIVHQPGQGLLDNLHTAAKTPEVIHVITGWPGQQQQHHNITQEEKINLAGFGLHPASKEEISNTNEAHNSEHENSLLTTLLVILLIIMLAIGMGFLYVYRRYHLQKAQVEAALAARNVSLVPTPNSPIIITPPPPLQAYNNDQLLQDLNNVGGGGGGVGPAGSLGKSFLKPLPDLPAFTQMVRNKIEGPDLYDSPSNSSSITISPVPTINSYAYARKESLYSVVTPKSRKGSMDSHLYDEIRYPTAMQHHHSQHHHQHHQSQHGHHQQQQQQQPHMQHHSTQHNVYIPQHQPHYPTLMQHQQAQQLQQLQSPAHTQNPSQGTHGPTNATATSNSTTHHISHLIIPPQNTKYLQVPQLTHSSHKVAHI
uniref:EMI domain-containing protein n=1 Tax=Stomoxys calcitrans TaxID=35570 RepID=A0A1I8QAS7_STOCA